MRSMIQVRVQFFGGWSRPGRRLSPEIERALPTVSLEAGATIGDLLRLLNVPAGPGRPFVSLNGYYERDDVPLRDGDRVQLLPPAAGG